MARRSNTQKADKLLAQIRLEDRRRRPVKIKGVPFIYHNGLNYHYKCKYASPMVGAAKTLKECVLVRNVAIKNKVGPFIFSELFWPNSRSMIELVKKVFYEDDGVVYWAVSYITPRKIFLPGDIAEVKYKYCQIKVLGRTLMSHNVVWALNTGEWAICVKHKDGNLHNNRIGNLY